MAISPLAIATQGLLNSPLSVAAVRGRLTIEVVEVRAKPGGGSVPAARRKYIIDEPIDEWMTRVRREDEEILELIIISTEVLDG